MVKKDSNGTWTKENTDKKSVTLKSWRTDFNRTELWANTTHRARNKKHTLSEKLNAGNNKWWQKQCYCFLNEWNRTEQEDSQRDSIFAKAKFGDYNKFNILFRFKNDTTWKKIFLNAFTWTIEAVK